jgi:L-alanine-DL-glutamate epimerase-like enolase superfamily enzyme
MTRRTLLRYLSAAPFLARYHALAAPEKRRTKIRDLQTMVVQGPRTYTLVKVVADDGLFGIGEAYGSPAVGVKEQVLSLKAELVGRDPLEIDTIYTTLGEHTPALSGTRTDGSAHMLLRAVSGIEMALWDLSGRILNQPVSILLGGRFRDRVRMYDHAAPKNMLDPASVRDWAQRIRSDPAGFRTHKFGFPNTKPGSDHARDRSNRLLTTTELLNVRKSFENCREAIGYDHDLMVHCHWQYDLRTSIQLSEAVEAIRPVWLEDPLPPDYSDSWKRLTASSRVPICTGENTVRRQGFKDFIINQACDILHPDLRNTGGFLEAKRIADMADVFGLPMATHNTGSMVATLANVQWAASIRDYIACETVTGQGGWIDEMVLHEGPIFRDGHIAVSDKPGLGIELNPDVVRAHLAAGEQWWG